MVLPVPDSEDVDLKDAIAFLYEASIQCKVWNQREVLLSSGNPLYMSDE